MAIIEELFSLSASEQIVRAIKKIESIKLPEAWRLEQVAEPSVACLAMSRSLVWIVYKEHGIIPLAISPSKVEGVFLKYAKGDCELRVEIDNEMDIVGCLTKGKEIVASELITDESSEIFINLVESKY